jgi:hypothetical protein
MVPWLNLSSIQLKGQMFEWMPEASMGCPCVGQNASKEQQKWEINKNSSISNFYIEICLSWVVVNHPSICHSSFGSYLEVNMFLKLGCSSALLHFVERGLAFHMDWLNTKGSNLKPDPIRFWTHNVWICF